MTKPHPIGDPVEAVSLLDEPNRRRLYELMTVRREPISRDEAARELGISRELAAFHLDRLLDAGLLEADYRRLRGRTGPGAGRPSKVYKRTQRDLAVSFPSRRYDVAAELLATAFDRLDAPSGAEAVAGVARELGTHMGLQARRSAGGRPSRKRLAGALLDLLRGAGYVPELDSVSGAVCLRNCPYHALAESHRVLTCGMNLAWADGVAQALGDSGLRPELDPKPGY
ncbi:MAG TPA: helix-turn-helix domain-containing protein, partial [Candidatus Limnocylindria bacterium]|nr:helix-turn-helix domain-containing protein [Candidatus Limnocylindria bacterium]